MEVEEGKLCVPAPEPDAHKENTPRNVGGDSLSRPRLCRLHRLPQCSLCTLCVTSALHQVLAGCGKVRAVPSSSQSYVDSRTADKTINARRLRVVGFVDPDDSDHMRDSEDADMDMDMDADGSAMVSQSPYSICDSGSVSSLERSASREGRRRSFSPTRFCGSKDPQHRRHSIPMDADNELHLLYMDAGRLPWQLKEP